MSLMTVIARRRLNLLWRPQWLRVSAPTDAELTPTPPVLLGRRLESDWAGMGGNWSHRDLNMVNRNPRRFLYSSSQMSLLAETVCHDGLLAGRHHSLIPHTNSIAALQLDLVRLGAGGPGYCLHPPSWWMLREPLLHDWSTALFFFSPAAVRASQGCNNMLGS